MQIRIQIDMLTIDTVSLSKKNLTNINRKRKLLRGNDSEESILSLNSIQRLNERLWSFRNLTVHKETQK